MGQGLQVWDANGVNLVDTDYRMTQIIGSVYTPDLLAGNAYVNGSIHVPEFATLSGAPFVHHIPYPVLFNERMAQFSDVPVENVPGFPGWTYEVKASESAYNVRIEGNYVKWIYPPDPEKPAWNEGHKRNVVQDFASLIIWGVF